MPLLQRACQNGQKDVAELLMRHGADINRKDGGTTPLTEACKNKHFSIVETLLEQYVSLQYTIANSQPLFPILMYLHVRIPGLSSKLN